MKNQYVIQRIMGDKVLYYNEDFNVFGIKHPTIYTNKRKAEQKKRYAEKYGNGSGKIVIVKL